MQRDRRRGVWRLALAAALAAAVASADPTAVRCGPTHAACGPAIVGPGGGTTTTGLTTTTSATTTTLASAVLPSWVPSMLAAWMLDESSGTRVNAQGTTSRDLSSTFGTDPSSSTDRQEGARSISLTAPQERHTSDTFTGVVSPLSMGCWAKMPATPSADAAVVMRDYQTVAGTMRIDRALGGGYKVTVRDSTNIPNSLGSATVSNNAWHHVAATMVSGGPLTLYVDGIVAAGPLTIPTVPARNDFFYVGDNNLFTGLVDECWFANLALSAASVCRICSCGLRGEQCTCNGAAFVVTGRNATACNSCTLPSDCTASTPP